MSGIVHTHVNLKQLEMDEEGEQDILARWFDAPFVFGLHISHSTDHFIARLLDRSQEPTECINIAMSADPHEVRVIRKTAHQTKMRRRNENKTISKKRSEE